MGCDKNSSGTNTKNDTDNPYIYTHGLDLSNNMTVRERITLYCDGSTHEEELQSADSILEVIDSSPSGLIAKKNCHCNLMHLGGPKSSPSCYDCKGDGTITRELTNAEAMAFLKAHIFDFQDKL
jgi:hypothetical protein